MVIKDDLSNMKVAELRQMLEERGLDTSGKKSELVERLLEATQSGEVSVHDVDRETAQRPGALSVQGE